MPSPARDGQPSLVSLSRRPEPIDLCSRPLHEPLLLPLHQPLSYIIGIKSQRLAHIGKGEKPVAASFLNPFFRVLKKQLAFTVTSENIFLVTCDGVFQYRQHELFFRLKV